MEELVSIVIPTYNRADLIEDALISSINQTYSNKEIIVVDDGSQDNTREVCKKYVDAGEIRYIFKENGGIGSALNRGIAEMNGAWFKWLSSDDILLHNAVEELLRFAYEKNAKFVYSDYILIDQQGNKLGEFIERTYDGYLNFAADLWRFFIGNGSSALIHKGVFQTTGMFATNLRHGEDYEFWLRACILQGLMLYRCPQILLKYRVHGGQLSSEVANEMRKNDDKIRQGIKKEYVSMYGKHKFHQLMAEFEKRKPTRPLWRRMARKVLDYAPSGIRYAALEQWSKRESKRKDS